MPKGADPLSAEEVQLIRDWIAKGAQWPKDCGLNKLKSMISIGGH